LAIFLLKQTPIRVELWPKVVNHKFKENFPQTYATKDLVEQKKRKKIFIQDLQELKPMHGFCNMNENAIKQNWQ
jgi:hypothetical protein